MRTLRLSLVGTVILALLVGLSLAVVAQDEGPTPITFVTGMVTELNQYEFSEEDDGDLSVADIRGYEVMTQSAPLGQVVEWSDPRLPTDLWLSLGFTRISQGEDQPESVRAMNLAWQSLLEDEQGRWRETGRSVLDADEKYSLYVLTGEGAYDGLSALLRGVAPDDEEAGLLHAHAPWDMAYEGYIFEAELTPMPDPVEPPAE